MKGRVASLGYAVDDELFARALGNEPCHREGRRRPLHGPSWSGCGFDRSAGYGADLVTSQGTAERSSI